MRNMPGLPGSAGTSGLLHQPMRQVGGSTLLEKAGKDPTTVPPAQLDPLLVKYQFQSVMKANAEDGVSRMITINCGVENIILPAVQPNRRVSLVGRVQWGTGGTNYQALFDYKNGTQFSIGANSVQIDVAFAEIATETADSVRVKASLDQGPRASRSQLMRSFPRQTIAEQSLVTYPVPDFAHSFYIFSDDPTIFSPGNVQVRFISGPSTAVVYAGTDQVQGILTGGQLDAANFEDGIRFPEATRFISILNNTLIGGGITYNITPTFTLSM